MQRRPRPRGRTGKISGAWEIPQRANDVSGTLPWLRIRPRGPSAMSSLGPHGAEPTQEAATWRKIVAAALDFLFAFFVAEYVVGYLSGKVARGTFELNGAPAVAV